MLVSLTLLAEDAKTANYGNISDCVVARAAKRVMKPEFFPLVGSSHLDIYSSPYEHVSLGCKLSRPFLLSEMNEMARLNENRTIQVDIPEEYLL